MAAKCDVLLHSVRAASAARLGLSYETLAARNPRLIYCHVKGFSDAGAYAGRPAYDDIVQALSGLAMLQTVAAGEPRYVPSIIADKITAVHAAYAITLALFHRERSGRGQSVGVPMMETMVAFNSAEHLGGCVFEPPEGRMGYEPVRQGMRRPFKTLDGWLCVLPYTDTNWQRFFELAERSELAADPRFATQRGRQKNLELVLGELAKQLATRSSSEWLRLLLDADIPCAAVNDLEDLLSDPHLESVDFWKIVEHPTEGKLRLPANPIELSASPPSIRRAPPRLGEHTAEVLRSFGYDPAAIERLTRS
jgi:crotonobetainyl-CoA:carnitine CoA-transferase CaiB-like acyl-CoA transferase